MIEKDPKLKQEVERILKLEDSWLKAAIEKKF